MPNCTQRVGLNSSLAPFPRSSCAGVDNHCKSAAVSKSAKMCEKSGTILRFSNKNFSYSEYSCSCSCSAASSKASALAPGSPPCTCAGTCVRRDGDARAYIYAYACGGCACYGRANPTSANCPVPTARSMLQTEPVDCTCMGRGTWRSRGPSCSRPRDGGYHPLYM